VNASNLVECSECHAVVESANLSRHRTWHRKIKRELEDLLRKIKNLE